MKKIICWLKRKEKKRKEKMASTRNRNGQGEYDLEQRTFDQSVQYALAKEFGVPHTSCLPGRGLLHSKMHHAHLSYNGIEVESCLFGIGSTRLSQPAQSNLDVRVHSKQLQFLNIFSPSSHQQATAPNLIMPENTRIRLDQRPYMSASTL